MSKAGPSSQKFGDPRSVDRRERNIQIANFPLLIAITHKWIARAGYIAGCKQTKRPLHIFVAWHFGFALSGSSRNDGGGFVPVIRSNAAPPPGVQWFADITPFL
jgi:hypothetical protein